jgi:hypothetical protein
MAYTLKERMFEKYVYSIGVHLFTHVKHVLTLPTFLGLSENSEVWHSFCALHIIGM